MTKDGKTELMHLVVHPKLPGVYFLGFIQAHGPMIPCVESQMSYAADLIQVGTPGSLWIDLKGIAALSAGPGVHPHYLSHPHYAQQVTSALTVSARV